MSIEQKINYKFKNLELLATALRHATAVNEASQKLESNERMEYFGDALLSMLLAEYLYNKYPEKSEGELSLQRAWLQNKNSLAYLANVINLGEYIEMGSGELQNGGRVRKSLLADSLEALFAAIYLDSDFHIAKSIILKLYDQNLDALMKEQPIQQSKNLLQTIVNRKYNVNPEYVVADTSGPPHQRIYKVQVMINGSAFGSGIANNKKTAEMIAALSVLKNMNYECK